MPPILRVPTIAFALIYALPGVATLGAAEPARPPVAPPTTAETAAAAQGPVVELSPFEVNAEDDAGYQAANTTSGSRLNTSLRDTAAMITPFTKEFLADLAITNIEEMMQYANNVEPEFEDGSGFNNQFARRPDSAANFSFRMRGQTGGFSVDLAETGAPVDMADIERVEVASGPNAILFGTGAGGGLVSMSTKRANVRRDSRQLQLAFGSWGLCRGEFDYNQVLKKDRLAVRVWGLYGDREGWRYWDFEDTRRLSASLTARPFKNTTVSGSFTRGELQRHVTNAWNAGDQITLWRALGARVYDGTANVNASGTAAIATVQRYTFIENDGVVRNYRNELVSRGYSFNNENEKLLLPREQHPYEYSFSGPAQLTSDFRNWVAKLEQRVTANFQLEAGYQHNESFNTSNNYATAANMVELSGDPNLSVPDPSGVAQANARAGQLYMETNWRNESVDMTNDVFRLTGAYQLKFDRLGRWGRWLGEHRLAGMYEWGRLSREKDALAEILVDAAGAPITNVNTPETNTNFVWRRNYVTEGDYRTYYMSDYRLPVPTFTAGGRQFSGRYISFAQGSTDRDTRFMNTGMFAMQNFWLNRRLVTTYGHRVDRAKLISGVTRRADAADPRVLSGEKLLNEWAYTADTTALHRNNTTETMGAVAHLHRRVSLFYNQSSNTGTPRLDRTVLPGVVPPPSKGEGRDYGLMIDFLADDRFFVRVNRFNSDQIGDALLVPVNIASTSNYFTDSVRSMFDYLLQRGRVNRAEYDARVVGFSSFTIDVVSRGWEIDLVANPTRQWTLRLGGSFTERGRTNYFAEREPYLTETIAFLRARDDGGTLAGGRTIEQEIAALQNQIQTTAEGQEGSNNGARPWKGNFTTRYAFAAGRLKGAFVGGSFLYQDRYRMQKDAAGVMILGSDVQQTNLFGGYAWRTTRWFKAQVRLQLNVNNVFNTDLHDPGRYASNFLGLRRVILRQPRSFRLTTTLNW
jgi:iron complex outermembrane receptor protein